MPCSTFDLSIPAFGVRSPSLRVSMNPVTPPITSSDSLITSSHSSGEMLILLDTETA